MLIVSFMPTLAILFIGMNMVQLHLIIKIWSKPRRVGPDEERKEQPQTILQKRFPAPLRHIVYAIVLLAITFCFFMVFYVSPGLRFSAVGTGPLSMEFAEAVNTFLAVDERFFSASILGHLLQASSLFLVQASTLLLFGQRRRCQPQSQDDTTERYMFCIPVGDTFPVMMETVTLLFGIASVIISAAAYLPR